MPKAPTIPVRLPPDIIARLDRLAQQSGLSRTAIIKFCITTFTDAFPSLSEPMLQKLREQIHQLDGRSHRYSNVAVAKSGGTAIGQVKAKNFTTGAPPGRDAHRARAGKAKR